MIGDSATDARAAAAAGVCFALYKGGYGAAECASLPVAAHFASFAALPPLIAALPPRSAALPMAMGQVA